ncbi:extracellular solute-binding protein [Paenibacillus alvei]|uniref:Extracellular solute-binding protein n=2 Tax=Paenibacillus alvei TaxID=44250 RepID=A0AAP6ZVA7_PAEAL|nr:MULTISPECIES: extracellular solute-binding protein [Paenibacillus]MCY9541469.1 extracellular solute-binding protein [Paenibacillus alvei]MCY9734818.1 extracellular solute-binding protein [Paenibacillus alvei]MCY9757897.1 extracellular solute-binding protein [Paenibacillus alvei]MCY9760357.1 extracellular solute-binding protein [Paenibacillus alvei]MCY9767649.1 extracellular solute-binding protein [Paenibacillus alvei]
MKKNWVRKLLTVTLAMTMIIPMLAACTNKDEVVPGQERVLRIGMQYGGYDDTYFRQQWTDTFEITHKGIRIELVPAIDGSDMRYDNSGDPKKQPDRYEAMKKLLNSANPVDIVVTDSFQFRKLVEEGMLKQLDPLVQKDKIDLSDFVPTVIDGLKTMGDNNLYGLSPTFSSSALFFNKKMFSDAGIAPPTDNMTWDQVFTLAANLSKGDGADRKYGFSFNRYNGSDVFDDMLNYYVSPLNLRMFDDKGEKMTVNTPQWEKVWTTVSDLAIKKTIPTGNSNNEMTGQAPENENPFSHDNFLSGKVAMAISDYNYINTELADAMKNADKIKGFKKFDWDVVTLPSHPEAPGVSGGSQLYNIFSINQKAANPDDAWEFIKFINSEDWAKLRSRSSWEMVSRQQYIKPKDGTNINISAFYKTKPVPPTKTDMDKLMGDGNLWQINQIASELMKQVIDKKKSVSEALKEWETKGNQLLLQAKNGGGTPPGNVYHD